jgi:hypothetical protein
MTARFTPRDYPRTDHVVNDGKQRTLSITVYHDDALSTTVGTMATRHVAVRLEETTVAEVDALIPLLSTPWRRAKRSDVLRALIHAGLEAHAQGRIVWTLKLDEPASEP